MTSPSEPTLLRRIAAGDRAAVREFVGKYGGLVWSIVRRFEGTEAEDAVQEIFLDLWRSAARFDPSVASEATFVAMIARRRLIDRRRVRGRRPTLTAVSDPPPVVDDSSAPDARAEASRAARALRDLDAEQRTMVILATYHDMSHSEIAAQTGVPLGTVKARIRRGLLSIRAAILGVPTTSGERS